jgi:hypothetical protein
MRTRLFRSFVIASFLAVGLPAVAVTVDDAAFIATTIPLPDVNSADVVVVGDSIFVGQGGFGAGLQSILRRDADGTTTTVVSNLNALGGLEYDVAGDRLLFTDNGGNIAGATHGDTVYALPNPRAAVAAVNAATLTLLPSGSIPFAQAVLPLSGGDVLIGDAAGPGSGRVVKVSGGVPTNLITGLDYTAGVSLKLAGGELLVGNVDGSFVGSIKRYSLAGVFLGNLVGGLSGAIDQAVDQSGNLYVTGGFTDDFTSSTLTFVTGVGGAFEAASGFGFSSGVTIDGPSQQVLVLDFGAPYIDALLPIAYLTPGRFSGARECHVEEWGSPFDFSSKGLPRSRWTCIDGDPACDRDLAANGSCSLLVGGCVHVNDTARTTKCTPTDVDTVTVTSKKLPTAASALQAAIDAVLPATAGVCSDAISLTVPADKRTRTISFDARAAGKRLDKDVLKIRCLP